MGQDEAREVEGEHDRECDWHADCQEEAGEGGKVVESKLKKGNEDEIEQKNFCCGQRWLHLADQTPHQVL